MYDVASVCDAFDIGTDCTLLFWNVYYKRCYYDDVVAFFSLLTSNK